MSFERLIARRFLQRDKSNFSRPLVSIATYTIALGVVVMILAVSILRGFQKEITDKVVGFGSHITIRSYGWVNDYDEMPIELNAAELQRLSSISGIDKVQAYAYKGGMLKTEDQIHGIIFKGMSGTPDSSFFSSKMVRGRIPRLGDSSATNEVAISQRLSKRLHLDTGQKARTYFWVGNTYRARALQVVGIYNTDLSEFDDHYIIGDLSMVQRLNGWNSNQVAGYELLLNDFSQLDPLLAQVKQATRPDLSVTSIKEEQPSMFAWLELLNSNIILILIIMAVVCAASVVSALLIMIFEKTSMIGLLKTLGSTNRSIRHIFILKAFSIVGRGILIGNLIAFVLSFLQAHYHIVRLDSESYSMSFVPVDMSLWYYLAISLGTIAVCMLALLLPSTYIAHIDPAKTVRIE